MSKKWKVEIPDSVLKDIPDDERDDLIKQIKEAFENCEDPTSFGEPVEALPKGVTVCPHCGTSLLQGPVSTALDEPVQFFDCPNCLKSFTGEPLN